MTAKELVAKVLDVAKNYKTVYMWGVFGAPVTESVISGKTRQYPSWYSAAKQALFRSLIGKGYFGFDCVNLIKGILWGWNGDINATYGGAKYASNGVPDTNADGMIKLCKDVSTDFRNILPGEVVWMPGHIGVYVGDGLAVECTPRWSNNVQLTAVGNIGKKAGYNTRTWTNHGKLPYVTYEVTGNNTPGQKQPTDTSEIAIGTEVVMLGTKHYVSSNSASAKTCKPGLAKVTAIARGAKHPYHLINISGKGSTVYGWVDEADIQTGSQKTYTVKSGDSLWAIAAKQLGNGNRYTEIKSLNNLKNDIIHPGQVLKIPQK
jgi:LysM repeat protein